MNSKKQANLIIEKMTKFTHLFALKNLYIFSVATENFNNYRSIGKKNSGGPTL